MRARIVGGALAWAVSLTPLVVVNLIAYLGVFTLDEAAVIGAVALVAGVALGALTAGLVGGRAPDLSADAAETTDIASRLARPGQRPSMGPRGAGAANDAGAPRLGARGALAVGGLAATLYAVTMAGVILLASAFNILPNLVTQHPLRITAAILCVAAIFVRLAMLVGWLAARGHTAEDMESASPIGAPVAAGGRVGGIGAAVGPSSGARAALAPALRPPVPATRPLGQSAPIRGGAARATRPLSASDYDGPGAYPHQPGYGDQSAYDGYSAYARPMEAPPRPGDQRDRYTTAPAGQTRDAAAHRGPYSQRPRPDAAEPRDDDDGDAYAETPDDGYLARFGGHAPERHERNHRRVTDRRSTRRDRAEAYDDDRFDDDGFDEAADWRSGGERRPGRRTDARRRTRDDDRHIDADASFDR